MIQDDPDEPPDATTVECDEGSGDVREDQHAGGDGDEQIEEFSNNPTNDKDEEAAEDDCAAPPSCPPVPEQSAIAPESGGMVDDEDVWCGGAQGEELVDVEEDEGVVNEDDLVEREEAVTVPRPLITSIASCLQHIVHSITHADSLLSQPLRYVAIDGTLSGGCWV